MADYYTDEVHGKHEYLDLGNFALSTGYTLPGAGWATRPWAR